MDKIFAKPGTGLLVPQADGTPWPAVGMHADRDEYVRRRLRDGDLVLADPPAATASPTADPPSTPAATQADAAESDADAGTNPDTGATKRRATR